ncbi:MAG: hypothetical protein HFG14_09925 [Lachnospiraceae bacterium]|nr:hypothetical protein [Lachnospiraceae bacterium]NBJ81638.1 hypothetical protein [bacterium 1XD42-76]NBK05082.1 hypothetical protein [bacterium 1XD42-94]
MRAERSEKMRYAIVKYFRGWYNIVRHDTCAGLHPTNRRETTRTDRVHSPETPYPGDLVFRLAVI